MSVLKAIDIIERNSSLSDFCGPVSIEKIAEAENILGIKFPENYKTFLKKFGAGDIEGIEIFGIIKDPKLDKKMIPNAIWLTQNLRAEENLPNNYVVVSETGYGSYYILETIEEPGSVHLWFSGAKTEKIAKNFGDFLDSLLQESGLS